MGYIYEGMDPLKTPLKKDTQRNRFTNILISDKLIRSIT